MKSWTRRGSLGGPRFRSSMEPHEVQILHSLVSDLMDLLEQRRESAPRDELAELTGITTGHSRAPDEGPLRRLLPDFHRPEAADDPAADGPAAGGDVGSGDVESGDGSGRDGAVEPSPAARAAADAQNAGMRMLHEPAILEAKLTAAATVLRTLPARGGTVSLTADQAAAWTTCLNDLRLSLGQTLAETDSDGHQSVPEELDPADPRAPHLEVYHWLTFIQDSLCDVLMGG